MVIDVNSFMFLRTESPVTRVVSSAGVTDWRESIIEAVVDGVPWTSAWDYASNYGQSPNRPAFLAAWQQLGG